PAPLAGAGAADGGDRAAPRERRLGRARRALRAAAPWPGPRRCDGGIRRRGPGPAGWDAPALPDRAPGPRAPARAGDGDPPARARRRRAAGGAPVSAFPLRYARRNVLLGPGGEAAALYRAEPVSYPFLP